MDEIIKQLQGIQEDIVGILVPTMITSFIALITLIINTILQFKLADRQYKSKQFEIMRSLYPKIKDSLLSVICCFENLESNRLYTNNFSIANYINIDWTLWRSSVPSNLIECIDSFEENTNQIIAQFLVLNGIFKNDNVPTSDRKMEKELNEFQKFCTYVFMCKNGKQGGSQKVYNKKEVEKFLCICNKHYNKF